MQKGDSKMAITYTKTLKSPAENSTFHDVPLYEFTFTDGTNSGTTEQIEMFEDLISDVINVLETKRGWDNS